MTGAMFGRPHPLAPSYPADRFEHVPRCGHTITEVTVNLSTGEKTAKCTHGCRYVLRAERIDPDRGHVFVFGPTIVEHIGP